MRNGFGIPCGDTLLQYEEAFPHNPREFGGYRVYGADLSRKATISTFTLLGTVAHG